MEIEFRQRTPSIHGCEAPRTSSVRLTSKVWLSSNIELIVKTMSTYPVQGSPSAVPFAPPSLVISVLRYNTPCPMLIQYQDLYLLRTKPNHDPPCSRTPQASQRHGPMAVRPLMCQTCSHLLAPFFALLHNDKSTFFSSTPKRAQVSWIMPLKQGPFVARLATRMGARCCIGLIGLSDVAVARESDSLKRACG